MGKPLEGFKILDLTRVISGPYCTQMLADFGAEVIKVEQPGIGDLSRALPPHLNGMSYHFMIANRNKKSVTLNLNSPKGVEIFKRLVQEVNVVIENFRPGVMNNLGIGYRELKKISPEVIYVSISGFGQDGPYSQYMAYDYIVQAMSGIMSVTGEENGFPVRVGGAIADYGVAVYGAVAVLAALLEWSKSREGQYIDISMQDCIWNILARDAFPYYFANGEVPKRRGNRGTNSSNPAPVNTYRAKDGKFIMIACISNNNWRSLAKIVGGEEFENDPRLAKLKGRMKNLNEIDERIQAWVGQWISGDAIKILAEAQIPSGIVLEFDDMIKDRHIKARHMVAEFYQTGVGNIQTPGSPFAFSRLTTGLAGSAPILGEHNEEIYKNLIRLEEKELTKLKEENVI